MATTSAKESHVTETHFPQPAQTLPSESLRSSPNSRRWKANLNAHQSVCEDLRALVDRLSSPTFVGSSEELATLTTKALGY